MIEYLNAADSIAPDQLAGSFEGWPNPPSVETHLEILRGSSHVVVALEEDNVVGFVNAISDGILSAYIPLLEVRKDRQGRGIGTELMRQILAQLSNFYMIDLMCDPALQSFYERAGLAQSNGAALRNYANQNGRPQERLG